MLLHLVVVVPGVLVVHVHLGARQQGHHGRRLDVLLQVRRDLRLPLGDPRRAAAGMVVHMWMVGHHVPAALVGGHVSGPLVGLGGGGGLVAVGEVDRVERRRGVGRGVLVRGVGRLAAGDGAGGAGGGDADAGGGAHHAVGARAGLHQLLDLRATVLEPDLYLKKKKKLIKIYFEKNKVRCFFFS